MQDEESVGELSRRLLRLALPLMTRHEVPVTPRNYAVWYHYASGSDPALRAAIDEHIASGGTFSTDFNEELYGRFVLESSEEMLESVRQSVRALLSTISGSINQSGDELKVFVEKLGEHCANLRGGLSEPELEALADSLLADTSKARASGLRLQRSMSESQQEADNLRADLQRALADAGTDPLTGLGNRRSLQRALRELGESPERGTPCSVMFADIDHFKKVNDNYGHLIGDKVLRYVATLLQDAVKGAGTVARYGGEEFVVLLPQTSYETALRLAETMRESVESGRLVRAGSREPIGVVTVSLGVAEWRSDEQASETLERADAALYAAKQGGRNRVVGERDTGAAGRKAAR